jgi:hypothetical protein
MSEAGTHIFFSPDVVGGTFVFFSGVIMGGLPTRVHFAFG